MKSQHKSVTVFNDNDEEVKVGYDVSYQDAPEYNRMSSKELRREFNFNDCEAIPSVAIVTIDKISENIPLVLVQDAIKEGEGCECYFDI